MGNSSGEEEDDDEAEESPSARRARAASAGRAASAREADAYAAALLTKAGIGIGPQISLFEKLDALTKSGGGRPPAWLLTHPHTKDRIAALTAMQVKWDS